MTSVVTTTPRRPLWHTLTVCLAILASGLLFQQVQRSSAAVTPSVTLTAAPGLLEVEWTVDQDSDRPTAHRLKWWTGSSATGNPTGEAVINNTAVDNTESIALPLTNGTYTVQVEQTLCRPWEGQDCTNTWTVVDSAKTAAVSGYVAPTCGSSNYVCGRATVGSSAMVRTYVYLGASSTGPGSQMSGNDVEFAWNGSNLSDFRSTDGELNGPWMRMTAFVVGQDGSFVSKWWSVGAFGDDGGDVDEATEVLVPRGVPNSFEFVFGDLRTAGMEIGGRISKESGTGAPNLQSNDFVDLCVQIFRLRDEKWRYSSQICSFQNAQFGFANLGDWKQKLVAGDYKIKVFDRANYAGVANLLNYNVKFAGEWWSSATARAENIDSAELLEVRDGDAPRLNLDVVLRPAKQLRVDVVDVPSEFQVSGGEGRISVADEFGNWTGGAMEYSTAGNKWTAAVTGLVEGRSYKIFLSFNGQGGARRWWLVGGGNLELAEGVVPTSDVWEEPWQPKPYLVKVYDEGRELFDSDEACMTLIDSNGDPKASACQNNGSIELQRVEPGTYTVSVWQKSTTTGEIIGNPLEFGPIEVSDDQSSNYNSDFACGISNLEADQTAQFGTDAPCVVILPRTVIESTTTTPSNS